MLFMVLEKVLKGLRRGSKKAQMPKMRESWEVALPGTASQAGASYRLS